MGAIFVLMLPACLILPPLALLMLGSAFKDVDRERDEMLRYTIEAEQRSWEETMRMAQEDARKESEMEDFLRSLR